MKIFKTSKFRILSNVLKYSFVGVFAVMVLMSAFFVNKSTRVANAAVTDHTLKASKLTFKEDLNGSGFITSSDNVIDKAIDCQSPTTGCSLQVPDGSSFSLTLVPGAGSTGKFYTGALDACYDFKAGDTICDVKLMSKNISLTYGFQKLTTGEESINYSKLTQNSVELNSTGLLPNKKVQVRVDGLTEATKNNSKYLMLNTDSNGSVNASFTGLIPKNEYRGMVGYDGEDKGIAIVMFSTLALPSPKITGITPTTGKITDTVTIIGENFGGISSILFGTLPVGATDFSITPTQIIVKKIPVGFKSGVITVKTTSGEAVSSQTFSIGSSTTSSTGETIKALNLTSTSVTIHFETSGLTPATPPYTIYISDKNNPNTYYERNQNKNIESGNLNQLGVADINFTNLVPNNEYTAELVRNATSIQKIDFKTPMTALAAKITDINPKEGKEGTEVTISGEYLSNVVGVYFNQTLGVTSTNTQSEIVVKVPVGATSGNISIKIGGLIGPNGPSETTIISPTSFNVLDSKGAVIPPGAQPPSGLGSGSSGAYTTTDKTTAGKPIVWHGLVPECNTGTIDATTGNYSNPCDFNMVMAIINRVISFLLVTMATPLFALIIIYAGWLYLSDMGSSENITKAKKILKNAIIGYVVALAAWLIVKTILTSLGFTGPMYLSLLLINYI